MLPMEEFRVLDLNAEGCGVTVEALMESAGKALADQILARTSPDDRVLFICGTGNNGGDAMVAARMMDGSRNVSIHLPRGRDAVRSPLCMKHLRSVEHLITDGTPDMSSFDLIADAMLGTGAEGTVREPYSSIIRDVNSSGRRILSVDVPSGMGTDSAVSADVTVTFHDVKEGMTAENSGEIAVADIGIPRKAAVYVGPGEFSLLPEPDAESHKGQNGRLLIVGGGPYTGAPALAGMAAYRCGVDLVRIATPERSCLPISCYSPLYIVHPLSGDHLVPLDKDEVLRLSRSSDAMVMGPGLGNDAETVSAVKEILENAEVPVVVDADAIGAIPRSTVRNGSVVVTPHDREFSVLTGERPPIDMDERMECVGKTALRLGMTIVLKGRVDVISDGKRVKLNPTGNPGMTVGGTGDVLAGIIGALLAKGMRPFDAARLGALINGMAGDLSFAEKGIGLTPLDIIEDIPHVMMRNKV